jgi:hypothetical protein
MIGGQQGNSLLELIKQGKLQKKAPAKKEEKAAAAAAAAAAANAAAAASRPVSAGPATSEVRNCGNHPPRFPCAMSMPNPNRSALHTKVHEYSCCNI